MSLCCKTRANTTLMYEVPDKDTTKSESRFRLLVAKCGNASKGDQAAVIQSSLHKVKNRLSMADVFCVCMMPFPLAVSSLPYNRSHWR